MKKYIFSVIALGLLLALPTYAAIEAQGPDNFLNSPIVEHGSILLLIINIIRWMYTLIFIFAVGLILVAAFNFIRGGADPKHIETAKLQIRYAVIAMVIALVASGVSWVIRYFIAGRGLV